mmetsp:Transcript_14762/g.45785  ORF Transcript_14762/g.45785 Transcript_14762/m.45785 type:complete len:275 (+) Transcript_14762:623-1447(+)
MRRSVWQPSWTHACPCTVSAGESTTPQKTSLPYPARPPLRCAPTAPLACLKRRLRRLSKLSSLSAASPQASGKSKRSLMMALVPPIMRRPRRRGGTRARRSPRAKRCHRRRLPHAWPQKRAATSRQRRQRRRRAACSRMCRSTREPPAPSASLRAPRYACFSRSRLLETLPTGARPSTARSTLCWESLYSSTSCLRSRRWGRSPSRSNTSLTTPKSSRKWTRLAWRALTRCPMASADSRGMSGHASASTQCTGSGATSARATTACRPTLTVSDT